MSYPTELIANKKTNTVANHAALNTSLEGGVPSTRDGECFLSTDHLFQLRVLGFCEIDGKKYRDKLFSKCYSTAWVNCNDDQLLATSENGYCVLIPID